jgi:hypothetical protein
MANQLYQLKILWPANVRTKVVVILVWIPHHTLHGGVVVLHPPAPPSSGRSRRGAAQERPHAPPVNPAASGSAPNGGHYRPRSASDGGAAGREALRDREAGGVGRGRHGRAVCAELRSGERRRRGGRWAVSGGREFAAAIGVDPLPGTCGF